MKKVYIKQRALTLCDIEGTAAAHINATPFKPTRGTLVELTDLAQCWHDVKEQRPYFLFNFILVNTSDGSFAVYDHEDVFGISDHGGVYAENSWQEFVENNGVKHWAYVTDLMPQERTVSND